LVSGAARIDGDCHKLTVVDVAAEKQGQIAPLSETGTSRVRNGDTHDRKTGTPMSPDSSMTHQDPSNARAREDLSNSDLDDRKRRPAVLHRFVSQDALDQVRTIASGWDRQMLLRRFLDWPGSRQARDMDAAFLAWCRSFTKGKPPT